MIFATYVSGLGFVLCGAWLVVASTGLSVRFLNWGKSEPSWRSVWFPALAFAVTAASFLIVRFVDAEAPVAPQVVVRGWIGFLCVFGVLSTMCAALMLATSQRVSRFIRQARIRTPKTR